MFIIYAPELDRQDQISEITHLLYVTFEYLPNGDIIVQNMNDKIIRGLSMAICASDILVIEKTPESKIIGEDVVLWFDIEAGEKVIIKIKK